VIERYVIIGLVVWAVWQEVKAFLTARAHRAEARDLLARIQARSAGEYGALGGNVWTPTREREADEEEEPGPRVVRRRLEVGGAYPDEQAGPGVGPGAVESPHGRMVYNRLQEEPVE
jgi:hypothetical protein